MEEAKVDSQQNLDDSNKTNSEDLINFSSQNQEEQDEEVKNMDKKTNNPTMTQQEDAQLGNLQQQNDEGQQDRDRTMDSTLMATNAADKRAEYYGGKLKWFRDTRPIQKSVSTFNRIRGSDETNEETFNRWSNAMYSADVGITYLLWRLIFGLKDFSSNTYAIAQRRGLTKPPVVALGIVLLPAILTIMSPVLIGLTIIMVPTLFFGFIFLAIPSMFLMPFAIFFLYIFGGMPKLLLMMDRFLNIFFGTRRSEGGNRISDGDGGNNSGTQKNN